MFYDAQASRQRHACGQPASVFSLALAWFIASVLQLNTRRMSTEIPLPIVICSVARIA